MSEVVQQVQSPQVEIPASQAADVGTSLLSQATASLGPSLVQRKILQRAARRADGPPAATVQMDRASAGPPSDDQIVDGANRGVASGGGAIPHQAQMEKSFGVSFDHVQAYTGPAAAQACEGMGANAYAMGNQVAFKSAHPDPALVAHELTHVVQQSGTMRPKMAVGQDGDSHEQEADAVGARVSRGESVRDVVQAHVGHGGAASSSTAGAVQGDTIQRSPAAPGGGGVGAGAPAGGGAAAAPNGGVRVVRGGGGGAGGGAGAAAPASGGGGAAAASGGAAGGQAAGAAAAPAGAATGGANGGAAAPGAAGNAPGAAGTGGAATAAAASNGGAAAAPWAAGNAPGAAAKPLLPGPKGADKEEDMLPAARNPKTVQRNREATETFWGSEYMHVEVKPVPQLIGNLGPASSGKYAVGWNYSSAPAYDSGMYARMTGPGGLVGTWGKSDLDGRTALVYNKALSSTIPGSYSAILGNTGGIGEPAIEATESFNVVDPVHINTGSKRVTQLWDFDNPIPVQMVGGSPSSESGGPAGVNFTLNQSMVKTKRITANSSGSTDNTVTSKTSFGFNVGLDNDAGSTGGGSIGFSNETSNSVQRQWGQEAYHQAQISSASWQTQVFRPGPGESRSRMILPAYEWVEWDADVYAHDSDTLRTTGARTRAVIGMLRPTGGFKDVPTTDAPKSANSTDAKPTAGAQVNVDPNDTQLAPGAAAAVAAHGGWRTLPGAKWFKPGEGTQTLQFIRGPVQSTPAERDYGIQGGDQIPSGNLGESTDWGQTNSESAEDGMTVSHNEGTSSVTANNVSKSFAGNPGIKGIGSIGASASFENGTQLSNATGTGLSTQGSSAETTTVTIVQSVTKKPNQYQFILWTPLVAHKVFQVGYGARQPTTGNTVGENEFTTVYLHTFKHQPIPHVLLKDIPDSHTFLPRGKVDWPRFTSV